MSIEVIGAYINYPEGAEWNLTQTDNYLYGQLLNRTAKGLEVVWDDKKPPREAQVYVINLPYVIAVWDDKEEEDEGSNGIEAGNAGEVADAEPDERD